MKRSTTGELNYLEPEDKILGRFSKPFMMEVAAMFQKAMRQDGQRTNRVD
jgi:hypothetical protein